MAVVAVLAAGSVAITVMAESGSSRNPHLPNARGSAAADVIALYRACSDRPSGTKTECTPVPSTVLLRVCNSWIGGTSLPKTDLDDLTEPSALVGGQPTAIGIAPPTAVLGTDDKNLGAIAIACSHSNDDISWTLDVHVPSNDHPFNEKILDDCVGSKPPDGCSSFGDGHQSVSTSDVGAIASVHVTAVDVFVNVLSHEGEDESITASAIQANVLRSFDIAPPQGRRSSGSVSPSNPPASTTPPASDDGTPASEGLLAKVRALSHPDWHICNTFDPVRYYASSGTVKILGGTNRKYLTVEIACGTTASSPTKVFVYDVSDGNPRELASAPDDSTQLESNGYSDTTGGIVVHDVGYSDTASNCCPDRFFSQTIKVSSAGAQVSKPAPQLPGMAGAVAGTARSGLTLRVVGVPTTECATVSFGQVRAFLASNRCGSVTQALITGERSGRNVLVSLDAVTFGGGAGDDVVPQFAELVATDGTGDVDSLIRSGGTYPGAPATFAADPAQSTTVDANDGRVWIAEAMYVDGSTTTDTDPALRAAAESALRTFAGTN